MTSGSKAQTGTKATTSVTLAGDVTGPSSANTVAKINGSPLGTTTGATTGYVLTWNGSAWVPAAAGGGGGVTSFNTRTGAVVPANADYLAVASGGLTGATNATRYVGGTANGAPASGTFAVGDFIIDATASVWICVVAGTPGTWASSISNHVTLRSATATAKYNEITLFTGSTAGQTISAAGSPIDSVTWSVINNSSVPLTLSFSANAMYPLGSSSTVTSYTVGVASAYSFVNYNGGNWYMTATNDLSNGTGIVAVTNGGTGTSTAPAVGGIPVATSTSAYTPLAIGTNGQVLTSNGTTATWATASSGLSAVSGNITSANYATPTIPSSTFVNVSAAQNGLFTVINGQKDYITANSLKGFSTVTGDTSVYLEPGSSSLPSSWTAGTITSSKSWNSVTYGNGYFVAVASGTTAGAYSTNGTSWTASTMPSSQDWNSVAYGNGKFVAISNTTSASTAAAYSTDGITWTAATLPSSQSWNSVTYGNGYFVAVASGTTAGAYSTNGTSWTASTMPSSQSWNSVAYGNGKFVAVINGSNVTAYSTDGITWTAGTISSSDNWYIAYGNGKFVAISTSANVSAYSTNGITWTASTLPVSGTWHPLTYGNGQFVAISVGTTAAAYSADGITWTAATLPGSTFWLSVAYGNGKFVAISNGSAATAYFTMTLPKPTPFTILPVNITTNY